ncbi:hypothetical protein GCM10009853_032160 [Glycomyces scopariae]
MPSLDEAAASIRAAIEQARVSMIGIAASASAAVQLRDRLAALGFERKAREIGAVAQELDDSGAYTSTLARTLSAALAVLETLRGGGAGFGRGPSSGGGGVPPVPVHARRLAERLSGRAAGDRTRGLAYTHEDGEPVSYVSGRRRDAREGLTAEFASRFVVRDHAEGHLAADMRRPGGPTAVTLVLNNRPCTGSEGCDATVPAIIPAGATMTVYVTDASAEGVGHWATYTGTGEGIA